MFSLLIPMIAAFKLMAAPTGAPPTMHGLHGTQPHAAQIQVAQARPTGAPELTRRASDRLAASQAQQKAIESEMLALRKIYNEQLAEVDRLKRARASWRRDRQLRDQKARSQKTAVALQTLERSLRSQRVTVSRHRKALAQAIDRELSLGVATTRQSTLSTMLGKLRRTLRKAPRKISMPDVELDEFADPEELLEQIALIERAETKLLAEESSLQRRANHYDHMDALRSKRIRADEIGDLDDQGIRRSTSRVGSGKESRTSGDDSSGGAGLSDSEAEPQDQGAPPPDGFGGGGDFATSSIVLADVVDAGTQDALRRAQRSRSPRTKAEAAKQAKKQVRERLNRLRAGKERIRRQLQRLKK